MIEEINSNLKKIAIGTTNFGMKYGVANKEQTPYDEVKKIIDFSKLQGINSYDTAPLYGSSEKVLGTLCASNDIINTKIVQINNDEINDSNIQFIEKTFYDSLKNLKKDKIYSLLVHKIDNLLGTGGEKLFKWMKKLKIKGLINKIGVSVYNEKELGLILDQYEIDLVQLPLNILDQRFVKSGFINLLNKKSIEIHARSIFLQGLLLIDLDKIPKNLEKFKSKIRKVHEFAKINELSNLELLLNFAYSNKKIDKFIFGISSELQIRDIVDKIKDLKGSADLSNFSENDENLIIPKNW